MDTEGFKISIRTVIRDLQSTQAQEIRDELVRQQFADITVNTEKNPHLAMKYRQANIDNLTPKQIEQKIEGGLKISLDYGGLPPKNPTEFLEKEKQDATAN